MDVEYTLKLILAVLVATNKISIDEAEQIDRNAAMSNLDVSQSIWRMVRDLS